MEEYTLDFQLYLLFNTHSIIKVQSVSHQTAQEAVLCRRSDEARMRNNKRKTEGASQSHELASAVVLKNKTSVRKAAKRLNLCHVSLYRYVKKKKSNQSLSVG
ncbi:uncharacterized protein LOC106143479 [Amyelois transitella]|uniref:uncharacterized protein LOC106143479 n=1 Tax=Amyelois transitella TaxID=680683 RepID=UPI00067E25C0|nr:uncharacterized protein LOC106143479 [Amyelois transitella]